MTARRNPEEPQPRWVILDPITNARVYLDETGRMLGAEDDSGSGTRKSEPRKVMQSDTPTVDVCNALSGTAGANDDTTRPRLTPSASALDRLALACDRVIAEASAEIERRRARRISRAEWRGLWRWLAVFAVITGSTGASMWLAFHH